MSVRNRLKERRQQLNLSQEKVAMLSSISFATYSGIENGKRCPSVETALKIAKALKTSVNKIFALSYTRYRG